MTTPVWHTSMRSALGELTLVRDADGMRGLYFPHHWYVPTRSAFGPASDSGFGDVEAQLQAYLAGERREFELPLRPVGTPFQSRVWEEIQRIPYGETIAYGDLAKQVGGDPTAQEVGAAVGRNPLCVLIPCHRVVGRDGGLTGYAGGIARKRSLLDLEREHDDERPSEPRTARP